MKRQFFRCVLTTLLSLPLVATAQTSLSLPNNGKNEMDRQVAIHTQILRVEAPSNNKKIDTLNLCLVKGITVDGLVMALNNLKW